MTGAEPAKCEASMAGTFGFVQHSRWYIESFEEIPPSHICNLHVTVSQPLAMRSWGRHVTEKAMNLSIGWRDIPSDGGQAASRLRPSFTGGCLSKMA